MSSKIYIGMTDNIRYWCNECKKHTGILMQDMDVICQKCRLVITAAVCEQCYHCGNPATKSVVDQFRGRTSYEDCSIYVCNECFEHHQY